MITITISGPQGAGKSGLAGAIFDWLTRTGAEINGQQALPQLRDEDDPERITCGYARPNVVIRTVQSDE